VIAVRSRPAPTIPLGAWLVVAIVAWIGAAWLAVRMFSTTPPTAGFDLELLLGAGRDVAAGRSPYDPSLVAGNPPEATSLFYSYPPPVAQAMVLFAGLPSALAFALWAVAAVTASVAVILRLRARLAPGVAAAAVAITSLAVLPLVLPFLVALLFGNLDAFFPALYGLVLVGVLAAGLGGRFAGGAALATAAVAKVYPAGLAVWLLARAARDRGRPSTARGVLAWTLVLGLGIVLISVVLGGAGLWREYASVAATASSAHLVDPRNYGIAAQITLWLGGTDAEARVLQVPVALTALAIIAWAGWRRRDAVESSAWAAAASLFLLPVTWYHYPAALIPFAAAAVVRSAGSARSRVAWLVTASIVAAAVGIAFPPLLWVAIGCCVAATRLSVPELVPEPAA
jgi:hypothetical protein